MILKNIFFNFIFIFIFSTNVNAITLDLGSTLLGESGGGNFNLDETLDLQDQILTDYLKGSSEFNKALVIIMDAYDLKDESAKLQSQQNFLDGSILVLVKALIFGKLLQNILTWRGVPKHIYLSINTFFITNLQSF